MADFSPSPSDVRPELAIFAGLRVLHVAALPFPTQQGTQALVRTMMKSLEDLGSVCELVCYAHGDENIPVDVALRRGRDLGAGRSLRSGPSAAKIALDAALVRTVRSAAVSFRPDVVLAHHVEGSIVARAARVGPRIYVAHTSLERELASYAPDLPPAWMAKVGALLDRAALASARTRVAVTPLLAQLLSQHTTVPVPSITPPWECPIVSDVGRFDRRARPSSAATVAYVGNLDAYQGLDDLVAAIDVLAGRIEVRLVVCTASEPRAWLATLPRRSRERVTVRPLVDEADRAQTYAECDVVAVPRRAPGGIPVKLLDALARGLPVVTTRRALAGLPLEPFTVVAEDDDVDSFARGLLRALALDDEIATLARHGQRHVAAYHSAEAFGADLAPAIAHARTATSRWPLLQRGRASLANLWPRAHRV